MTSVTTSKIQINGTLVLEGDDGQMWELRVDKCGGLYIKPESSSLGGPAARYYPVKVNEGSLKNPLLPEETDKPSEYMSWE